MPEVITPKRLLIALVALLALDFAFSMITTGGYRYPLQIFNTSLGDLVVSDAGFVYGIFILVPFFWWRNRKDKKQITTNDIEGALETKNYSVALVLSTLFIYLLALYLAGKTLDAIAPDSYPPLSSYYDWLLAFPVALIFYVVVDGWRKKRK